jgi:tetratricopeptide (TPR) repeat protein
MALYLATLAPSVLPGDGGELIAAGHTLSIAHPPGYPLYLILARLVASAVPWGSVAYGYNFFSAVAAALTAALFHMLLREIGVRRSVALGISLALATHQVLWLQAVGAEVYTLSALFTVSLLLAGSAAGRFGQRSYLLLAYLGGLAISHHLTLVYALAGALFFPLFMWRVAPRPRTILACILLGLLGLSTWLYIPIRAELGPPLTWGATDTLEGSVSHVTAARYSWRLKTFDFGSRLVDLAVFFRTIFSAYGAPLIVLAAAGLLTSLRRLAPAAGALVVVLLSAVHFAAYNIPDIEGHILPAFLGIGVLSAIGVEWLVRRLGAANGALIKVIPIAVFVIPAVHLFTLSPRADHYLAPDYARAIARSARSACGPTPVVITATDLAGLSLAYLSYVEDKDLTLYIHGASHHSVIGSGVPTASVGHAVALARQRFGPERVCILGHIEADAVAAENSICGMVYVPGPPRPDCPHPEELEIRGVGDEQRDFFSRALSAEYYLHLANWHGRRQERETAIEYMNEAFEVAPGDAQTYIYAARLYVELDRMDRAEELLRQAIDAEPTHFFAHFALANVLQMDGRMEEAEEEYRKALRGNPQPAPTHINLGNMSVSRNQYAEAADHYRRALESDSSNTSALMGMALVMESTGRPDRALSYLDRAIRAAPERPSPYHAKASLLMESGRYEEAGATLNSGIAVYPDDPMLLSDLGLYYLRTDRPESASIYLASALEGRPDLLTARGNLAVAYERLGMIPEAIEQYRMYVEEAPPGRGRDMARRALRELGALETSP